MTISYDSCVFRARGGTRIWRPDDSDRPLRHALNPGRPSPQGTRRCPDPRPDPRTHGRPQGRDGVGEPLPRWAALGCTVAPVVLVACGTLPRPGKPAAAPAKLRRL